MTLTINRAIRLSALVLVSAGLALGVAAPASAHNYLVTSTPAEGEVLTVLPEEFVITTNDELLSLGDGAGGFGLQIQDADGLYYGDGCVTVDGPSMSSVAALGAPGDYLLTWQVVSIDGHTVSGVFPFSWAPADDTELTDGSATPPVCGEATPDTETESPPSADDTNQETAAPVISDDEPAGVPTDLLWIGGAIAAVVVAAGVTVLALTRKGK